MLKHLIFDDMTQCTQADVDRLLPLVSPERREQALRYKFVFGQWACLKSHELLTQLFSELDIDFKSLNITYNEHEKPLLNNGLFFNLSHCKVGIAAVVADHEVGIDIETFRKAEPALIKRTMNEEEQLQIAHSIHPEITFTLLWTQKEAVLKWKGTGIIDDLHHVLPAPCQLQSQVEVVKNYAWSLASSASK